MAIVCALIVKGLILSLTIHTANVPCDGECSFRCAIISGEEQCYCPVGLELSSPGGTQCIGKLSLS